MIRDRSWKLVHFLDHDDGVLTDLENDPDEIHNLWDDPTHAETKQRLLDAIRDWLIQSNHHTRNRTLSSR